MTQTAVPAVPALERIRALRLGPLIGAGLWGTLVVVAGYLALVLKQADQPYVIDEAAFPYAAEGVLHHGAPIFYNGETRPDDLGMWHPPLYIYTLALQLKIFGSGYVSVRMYGVIAVLIAFAVVVLTVRRLAPSLPQYGYVLLAAVMLWNPLIIAGTLVPDIDGTLGIVATAALLWLAVMLMQDPPNRRVFLLAAGVWALAWSTKFTLALLLGPVVMAAPLLRPTDRIRQFVLAGASVVAGFLAFLVVFVTLAQLADFPAKAPFDYFKEGRQRTQGQSLTDRLTNHLGEGGGVFWFLTPGLFLLAALAIVLVLLNRTPDVDRLPTLLLFGTGLYFTVAYAAITGSPFGFPKYWGIAVLPLGAVIAAGSADRDIARLLRSLASGRNLAAAIALGAVALAGARWGEGRLVPVLRGGTRDVDRLSVVTLAVFAGVAVLIAAYAALTRRQTMLSAGSLALATAAVAAGVGTLAAQTSVNLTHASAPYSTRYYLGERGFDDVIDYIKEKVPADAIILSAKDIGIQSGHRYYEDAFFLPMAPADLKVALAENPSTYLVTRKKWDYSRAAYPKQFKLLPQFFTPLPDQPAQDFTVWARRSRG